MVRDVFLFFVIIKRKLLDLPILGWQLVTIIIGAVHTSQYYSGYTCGSNLSGLGWCNMGLHTVISGPKLALANGVLLAKCASYMIPVLMSLFPGQVGQSRPGSLIRPCMHACMHASIHPSIHPSTHPCMHASTSIHTSIHPGIHSSVYFI